MKVQLSSTVLILTILTFVSGAPPERREISRANPFSSRALDTAVAMCKLIPKQCEIKNGKPVVKDFKKKNHKQGHFVANHKVSKIAAVQDDSNQNYQDQDHGSSNYYSGDDFYPSSQTYNDDLPTPSMDSNGAGDGYGYGQNGSPYPTTTANDDNSYSDSYSLEDGSWSSTQAGDPDVSQPTNTISSSASQPSSTLSANLPSLEQPDATQSSDTVGADGDASHTYTVTLDSEMIATGLCKPSRYIEQLFESSCPMGSEAVQCGAKTEYDCDFYSHPTKDVDVKWNSSSRAPYDSHVRPCTLQMEATFNSNAPTLDGKKDTSLADWAKNATIYLWKALETAPGGTTHGRIDAITMTNPADLDAYLVPKQMSIIATKGGVSSDDNHGYLSIIQKFDCPNTKRQTDCGFLVSLASIFLGIVPGLSSIASGVANLAMDALDAGCGA